MRIESYLKYGLLLHFLVMSTVYAVPQLEVSDRLVLGGGIRSIGVSPAGEYVVVGTEDGYVHLFNKSLKTEWSKKLVGPVLTVSTSANGEFTVAGDESYIYLLNKTSGLLWDRGKLIGDNVRDVEISNQGEYVAVGSSNRFLYLFDRDGMLWRKELDSAVQGVGISPPGDYIAAGTARGTAYLFRKNGEPAWERNLNQYISDVAMLGEKVLVASKIAYALSNGEVAWDYYPDSEATSIGASPNGEIVAIGTKDRVHLASGGGKTLFKYSPGEVLTDMAVIDDSIVTATGGEIRVLKLPDVEPPEVSITAPVNGSRVSGVITITASINEPLKSIRVLIDGNYACGWLPCNWDTSASARGEHIIAITAEDKSGNIAEEKITVFVESPLMLVEKTVEKVENLTGELKEELPSVSEIPRPEVGATVSRWRDIHVEIPRWAVGGVFILLLGVVIYRKRNGEKGYRWKPKKRRLF